jgi:hypothetical protein
MKKLAITTVCEEMEKCITEVKDAIKRANILYPNDRSYARNLEGIVLGSNASYIQILRQLRYEEKYLSQPKFKKCFDK